MRKVILMLFFCLFCSGGLWSQQIKHYNNNSGLSHNTVMSLFQDSKGFMWIGTKNGLNRFDGHEFKIYQRGDSLTELRNSMIYCITEDKEKTLWIATDKGVSLYNPFTETFSNFNKQTDRNEKVEGYINKIFIDKADRVWILSGEGLFLYKPSEDKLYNLKEKFAPYTDYSPWALFVDDDGVAYLGFPNIGVIKYDIGADKTTYLAHNNNLPTVICGYKDKYILFGTRDKGLFLINKETGDQEKLLIDESLNSDVYVRHIEEISKDEYWIGAESGIYVLKDGTMQHIIHEDYNDLSISNNAIYAICKDKEGGIWIGSYFGGVDYIPKQYSYFENFYPIAYKNSISGYRVREFVSDKKGNLWIATEDNGLNYYDTHTGLFTHISERTRPVNISFSNIQCLNLAGDKLWIGTFTKGVDVLDLKTNRCKHYEKDGMPNSILNNDIFAIYTDSRNTTWVSSTTELYTYVPEIDGFRKFEPMSGTFISDILEDVNGCIWFTTYNIGVIRYNPDTKEIKRFRYDVENPNSLCYDRITCVFQDSKQRLWFASEDNGFCRYNENDGTFTRITTKQGLPSNVVYKILEDDNQRFWLSTSNGLVSFNPETMSVEALYNLPNGLRSKQFNYNSGIKTEDGTLYFGSIDGFVAFNPKNFHPNENRYSVVLTGFYIFNQEVKGEATDKVLDQAIPYANAINLNYDQATFSFSFSALNYSTEGNGKYAYMLEGIDKKWNYVDNVFRISYNSIPPGDYVFHIKYSKDGRDWSDTNTTVNISIIPPLWRTSWAYALYTILIMGIFFFAIRLYVLKKKRQVEERMAHQEQEKKEEIYKAKIDFFTNVAHEIRTPITLIKAPLDYILTSQPDEHETKENLITMERNTDRLLVLVNQLLDFRKIESKAFTLSLKVRNINVLVANTFNRFVPTGKRKKLEMILEAPDRAVMALVDEEAITKVCSNLFNNAVKYSATYIKAILSVSEDSRYFRITVKNDGTPIPPDMRERIFEAFFQLKGAHPTQPGSGIGLTLASSLVQLHNGKLYLDEEAEDTAFVVEIPTNVSADAQQVEDDVLIEEPITDEDNVSTVVLEDSFSAKDVVLVVEDNEELQSFLTVQLSKYYKVLTANNGMEAMEVLKDQIVNLIVSDIMMPLKNGLELCNEIKSNIETCHIPVILLTAKTTLNNKIEGLNSGADAYMEKPFAMPHLLVQIKNLLESRMKLRQNFANSPYIATNSMAQNKADEDFLNKLTEIIRQNLDDDTFNIDDLAREVNMSRTSLHRKIKVITELTPGDFIRIIRLKKAAELLLEGEYRINEICMIVGIRSLSYFSKSFQKQFGVLPKDFAKSHVKQ
ncbi:hybrid sensor histidine kinase/response regulator transcription factor [Bacteroides oleiciplenus]|uniref:histidine kinase n=1 Tax=Bacteroides oleiciplenus TaxID=626931 RepID=A0A3E5BFV7_9BACE|nr:hybrid sensor histidine kinase/response regulator transcription factor [Bacteroides oleiciplenus]RGN36482.1 hybrid sensor histidine kinase/response regulator [Bacteroides oleiciplenus]